ncbi:decapping and exoribonuclease protein isoform X2 [Alligator mississippiensis]|uniref:decapping and exoribonuclease protein isoform X2 n=1 Tax=Alligator mississippiensis TaxID=8496 RepID=UPI002878076A|nr:decapping and exoribonuclease protein isoform X2 [Alligator mississippiensis]
MATAAHPRKRPREDDPEAPPPQRAPSAPPRTLPVSPGCYAGPFPFYGRPAEVGHFSLDEQRRYHGDARQLRYFAPPPDHRPDPPFDLLDGYQDRYVRRDEDVREGLDHLLRWVLHNRCRLPGHRPGQGRPVAADVVTWRGHLTKVVTTPYERREGWLLAATRFHGTIYVSEVETVAARAQRLARSEDLRRLIYMGYKFEQYMCAERAGGGAAPGGVVNTNAAYCTVLRARLGPHSLLFAAEVDCADPAPGPAPDPARYVELKTTATPTVSAQHRAFRRKLLKWWAQSFLPGVPRVVTGLREPDGSVAALETYETAAMFQLVRDDPGAWQPAACMNFALAFLDFLSHVVTQDDPRLVTLFAWEPGCHVSWTRHRDSDYNFLPTWYTEALTQDPSPPQPPQAPPNPADPQ